MQLKPIFISMTAIVSSITLAFAQQNSTQDQLDEINVTTDNVSVSDPLSGVTKPNELFIAKDKLRKKSSSLGNALGNEIGVHSSQFGGGASAPVVRGQEGVRLKILQNGSDVVDMSQISPDHAIAVDTLLAQQVEIVRGTSTLLYANASPAGVINVIDKRIPTTVPNSIEGDLNLRYSTNNNEKVASTGVSLGLGQHFVVRLEGLKRNSHNYKVPEFNLEKTIDYVPDTFNRSKVGTIGLSWIGDYGYLGASYSERKDRYGLPGHNHKFDSCRGHIIDSVNPTTFVNRYYLQVYPHLMDDSDIIQTGPDFHCGSGHESEAGHSHSNPYGHQHSSSLAGPWIDMRVKRADVKGEWLTNALGIQKMRVSFSHTDYYHDEKEEENMPINLFSNKGKNIRFEIFHQPIGGLTGVWGVQYQVQTSSANIPRLTQPPFKAGYTPTWKDRRILEGARKHWALVENKNRQISLFAVEQLRWNDFLFELGVRTEQQKITIDYDRQLLAELKTPPKPLFSFLDFGFPKQKMQDPDLTPYKHRATSYSLAMHWSFDSEHILSAIASHNERLPTSMELYYHGNHTATNSFEYGNKNLRKEESNNLELALSRQNAKWRYNFSVYYNHFKNRIFNQTLTREGNLSLNRYNQGKADYYGVEGKLDYQLTNHIEIGVFGDFVRGKLYNAPPVYIRQKNRDLTPIAETGNAPRVPPARLGVHYDQQITDNLSGSVEYSYTFAQRKTARLESETEGFHLLNAGLSYQSKLKMLDYELFINGNNLLNQRIYSHASYLPFVPQMGRNFVLGMNLNF